MATNSKARNKANYKKYHGTPEAIKKRTARNKARREAIKDGRIKKGDKNKDVDHKVPLSKGGSTSRWNTRVLTKKKNRSLGAKMTNNNPLRKKKYNTLKKKKA